MGLLQLLAETIRALPLLLGHRGEQIVRVGFAEQQAVAQFDDLGVTLFLLGVFSDEVDEMAPYRLLDFGARLSLACCCCCCSTFGAAMSSVCSTSGAFLVFFFPKWWSEQYFAPTTTFFFLYPATYRVSFPKSLPNQTCLAASPTPAGCVTQKLVWAVEEEKKICV